MWGRSSTWVRSSATVALGAGVGSGCVWAASGFARGLSEGRAQGEGGSWLSALHGHPFREGAGPGPWDPDAAAAECARRARGEARLRRLVEEGGAELARIEEWRRRWPWRGPGARRRVEALRESLEWRSVAAIYGDGDGDGVGGEDEGHGGLAAGEPASRALAQARRAFLDAHGCVGWTDEALRLAASVGPLLEVGAGRGHWQRALESQLGVDVTSYDDFSDVPGVMDAAIAAGGPSPGGKRTGGGAGGGGLVGRVRRGGAVQAVRRHRGEGRSLLLVYPGPGRMAAEALDTYVATGGEVLVYVGEGRGGANADADFFDALAAEWSVVGHAPVVPFRGGLERMVVLRRQP